MRNKFDEELQILNRNLIKMGNMCEEAIDMSIEFLVGGDRALIIKINEDEEDIDQMEREIEDLCLKLLLRQQPVASDLRMVSSALKMISDMERIGDHAVDISEVANYIDRKIVNENEDIKSMAKAASLMVNNVIKAFVNKDLSLAYRVMEYDDVVDNCFDSVKKEIAGAIADKEETAEQGLDLLMAAKYLERIGDHAVNIAEWVEFSITGNHTESSH